MELIINEIESVEISINSEVEMFNFNTLTHEKISGKDLKNNIYQYSNNDLLIELEGKYATIFFITPIIINENNVNDKLRGIVKELERSGFSINLIDAKIDFNVEKSIFLDNEYLEYKDSFEMILSVNRRYEKYSKSFNKNTDVKFLEYDVSNGIKSKYSKTNFENINIKLYENSKLTINYFNRCSEKISLKNIYFSEIENRFNKDISFNLFDENSISNYLLDANVFAKRISRLDESKSLESILMPLILTNDNSNKKIFDFSQILFAIEDKISNNKLDEIKKIIKEIDGCSLFNNLNRFNELKRKVII
ncbi:MAG: hypothetical protein R3Y64_09285 [Peptostreptococcaceae bacterium]